MKKQIFALATALLCSVAVSTAQPQPKSAADTRKAVHAYAQKHKDPKQAEVSIAKRVAEMKIRLSLTDKQAVQMSQIMTKAHADRLKEAEARRAAAQKARQEAQGKREIMQKEIDAVLTPEQKAEWAKFRSQQKQRSQVGTNHRGAPMKKNTRRDHQLPAAHGVCNSCQCQVSTHKVNAGLAAHRHGQVRKSDQATPAKNDSRTTTVE